MSDHRCAKPGRLRAVVTSLPAFEAVKASVLGVGGGPLVSLAAATSISAAPRLPSDSLTIALDALGPTYMQTGLDPGPGSVHLIDVERFAWRAVETRSAFRRA
jgi:hypothetical protein